MMEHHVRVHAHSSDGFPVDQGFLGVSDSKGAISAPSALFSGDEGAARYYLARLFNADTRSRVRQIGVRAAGGAVERFRLSAVEDSPLTNTRLVLFSQLYHDVPVFGSEALVELDSNRSFVAAQATVADVGEKVASVIPLTAEKAFDTVRMAIGGLADYSAAVAPEMTLFFAADVQEWRLAYLFRRVPAAPPVTGEDLPFFFGYLDASPGLLAPEYDYLADAQDGRILFYYRRDPTLDVPTRCSGYDELDLSVEFLGRQVPGGFTLSDPLRSVVTYDLQGADMTTTPPQDPATSASAQFDAPHRAVVSAHANAGRVFDFFKEVLMRHGIDNKGMQLVSMVNCTYGKAASPPIWRNAAWYKGRIWYGQDVVAGRLCSYARFLDIVGHELTHGVTEHSSALVYRDQSGALNESFSDLFGVLINNWFNVGPDTPVDRWTWDIGAGLRGGGMPLRDFSDPRRTGDPDHMKDFVMTSKDNGGVHTNSGIPNKAAYNLLTARDASGALIFSAREAAVLYYLTLVRLNRLAQFTDVLTGLVSAAKTYYAAQREEADKKVEAICAAYCAVGITCKS